MVWKASLYIFQLFIKLPLVLTKVKDRLANDPTKSLQITELSVVSIALIYSINQLTIIVEFIFLRLFAIRC